MKTYEVYEKSSAVFKATLVDEDGNAVALSALTTLTATLYSLDDPAKAVINLRNAQDIKNANNGTFHATSGLLTFELQPNDNVIVDTSRPRERHLLQFDFTYNAGAKTGRYAAVIVVKNLEKVT